VLAYIYKWYISCILNWFLSKQLTINKYTLLNWNIKILIHCITLSTRLRFVIAYTHSFGTDTHTWRFRPLIHNSALLWKIYIFHVSKQNQKLFSSFKIRKIIFHYYYLNCLALPRSLIVTPTVYPRVVLNHEFCSAHKIIKIQYFLA